MLPFPWTLRPFPDFSALSPGVSGAIAGNELLIPGVSDAHARLPENCQKEASPASYEAGNDKRERILLQQVTRYIPLFRNIERKHLCTEFIPYPTDVFFIFLCVISTSAIYQYAARFQTRPDIRNNPPLPLPADFHILRAPLAYATGSLRNIPSPEQGTSVNITSKKSSSGVKSDGSLLVTTTSGCPTWSILGKYLRTVADNLIGYQQTIVGRNASDMRRLTARSGAKVEHHYRFLTHILLQSLLNKHG